MILFSEGGGDIHRLVTRKGNSLAHGSVHQHQWMSLFRRLQQQQERNKKSEVQQQENMRMKV